MDDARMNLAVAITAIRHGAVAVNHVSAVGIIKDDDNVISGVKVKDELTNEEWEVPAKCVINATGPFTDNIRLMDCPRERKICTPSSGTHIVLPGNCSKKSFGEKAPF